MVSPLRRLLCIADTLSSGAPWLNKAEILARGCGASLELCAADVEHFISASWATQWGEAEYHAALAARRLQDLAHLVRPLRARGVDAQTGPLLRVPLEHNIGAHAAASRADLVIKSSQHAPTVPIAALLQTDWMLAHALSVPLLLVGGRAWPSAPVVTVIGDTGDGNGDLTVAARQLSTAVAGVFETVPAHWSDAARLIDYLRNRGVYVVAMPYAAARTDLAVRILEQLEADLLVVPEVAGGPSAS
jgi:hypothetical protein